MPIFVINTKLTMSISDTKNEFPDFGNSNADQGFYDTLKKYVNKAESEKAALDKKTEDTLKKEK